MASTNRTFRAHQQGAVLVVSLLILLTITVLGVAGLESTGLQGRMVSNQNDQEMAFQGAEAAVNDGREWMYTLPATIPKPWNPSTPDECTAEIQGEGVVDQGDDDDDQGDQDGPQQAEGSSAAKCQTIEAGKVLTAFGGTDPEDGLWWKTSTANSSWWQDHGWQYTVGPRSAVSTVLNATTSTSSTRSGGPPPPRYIVEDLGAEDLIEDNLSADTAATNQGLALYRITGYGEGSRDTSRSLVQGVYSFRP